MKQKVIRIVATDGDMVKDVGFVSSDKDITIGYVSKSGTDWTHFTYHEDGHAHIKSKVDDDEHERDMYDGPRLSNFKGFVSPGPTTIPRDLDKLVDAPEFDFDYHDSTFYIDTRHADKYESTENEIPTMTYQPYIIEPGHPVLEIIANTEAHGGADEPINFHLTTITQPWIGTLSWPSKATLEVLPTATTNFESL